MMSSQPRNESVQKRYEFLTEKLQWYKTKAEELRAAVSESKKRATEPVLLAALEVLDKLARDVLSWCEYHDQPPSLYSAGLLADAGYGWEPPCYDNCDDARDDGSWSMTFELLEKAVRMLDE